MYFTSGTSKILSSNKADLSSTEPSKYSSGHSPTLSMIKRNRHGEFWCSITYNTVYLWSARPDVMISKITRSEQTIIEDGENIDLLWKPDSTAIVIWVITCIYVLALICAKDKQRVLAFL